MSNLAYMSSIYVCNVCIKLYMHSNLQHYYIEQQLSSTRLLTQRGRFSQHGVHSPQCSVGSHNLPHTCRSKEGNVLKSTTFTHSVCYRSVTDDIEHFTLHSITSIRYECKQQNKHYTNKPFNYFIQYFNDTTYIDSYTYTLLQKNVYDEVCMMIPVTLKSSNYTYVISLISNPLEATSVATKIFT